MVGGPSILMGLVALQYLTEKQDTANATIVEALQTFFN